MKLIFVVLLGYYQAVDYRNFDNYIERFGRCQECIDRVGSGQYTTICMDENSDQNYCCNDAPGEPAHSNS